MRIYEGSPRQDFEEVFRSIGAFLDQRGMKDVLLLEAPDGFIVQGLVPAGQSTGTWSETMGTLLKETLTFLDDDIARFMEEAGARRGSGVSAAAAGGHYETSFRVIGRYMDDEKPSDVFFFEQEGAFVLRLLKRTQSGIHHELVEFTRDDITLLVARGPSLRYTPKASPVPGQPAAGGPAAEQPPAGQPPAGQPPAGQPADQPNAEPAR
jgi:hypothetical protein